MTDVKNMKRILISDIMDVKHVHKVVADGFFTNIALKDPSRVSIVF